MVEGPNEGAARQYVADPTDKPATGVWESTCGLYYYDAAEAERAVDFFPTYLTHHIGEFSGDPFRLLRYQAQLLSRPIFGWKHKATGYRRFRKLFAFLPKGSGKALALDTPIPTPMGWTTMGAVRVGQQVIDDAGRPTTVVGVSEVMTGRRCYRVTFDDGASIVADGGHLWKTEARRGERFATRTTEQIRATLRNSNGKYQSANHSVYLAASLALPDKKLLIDPYVFGAWLGDGDSDCARITIGDQDTELASHLRAAGMFVTKQTRQVGRYSLTHEPDRGKSVPSMYARLNTLGVRNNKHIPSDYLRASHHQRLALLQGLMDTDGHISPKTGACEFCSTDVDIARGALELILSLGIKANITESAAKLYGREVSRRWRIAFHPPVEMPVFRLSRKLAQQRVRHARRRLSGERRIVGVEPVESVPVKCITVASPSQMFLAGREFIPTHNSPWAAGTGLYLMLCDRESAAEIYALAADTYQARVVHTNAKVMVEDSDDLNERCEVLRDSIYHPPSRSTYRVLSADAKTKHGFRPSGAVFDEFAQQPDRNLYEAIKKSMPKRRQPLLILITHAGVDDEGVCFEEYEYSKNVLNGTIQDDACLPVIFEANDADDWTDPELPARVNPGWGITIQPDGVLGELKEALNDPRKQNDYKRFHLNMWTNQATSWIPVDWFDGCNEPLEADDVLRKRQCAAGFDLGQKYDLACLNVAFRHPVDDTITLEVPVDTEKDGPVKATLQLNYGVTLIPFFWIPADTMREREKEDGIPYSEWVRLGLVHATEGTIIDNTRIFDDIKTKILPRFPMLKQGIIGYDPAFATDLAINLRDRLGLRVAEVLQNYSHLSEPSQVFEALMKAHRVRHGGHRVLRNHVSNVSIKTDDAGRIRPVKPKKSSKKRIDGVVSAIIALKALAMMPQGGRYQMLTFGGGKGSRR